MRRRTKPAKAKVQGKAPARKPPRGGDARVRDLEKRLAEALEREADALKLKAEALQRETEALEQQTATSEILRVISSSPTDGKPVFDTIIQNAVRLLEGFSGVVTRLVGDQLHLAALTSTTPSGDAAQKARFPKPLTEDFFHGRAITTLEPHFTPDVESDPSVPLEEVVVARARGYRSVIAVPLVHEARSVGAMTVTRRRPGPFSDREIALLRTFADQAVIAIENVRLFKETKEALEQQTATSDILRVISQSQTDVQPVFDAIVRSAVRLCGGLHGVVDRFDGELIHFVAQYNYTPEALQMTQRMYPRRPDRKQAAGRAILTGDVVNIADLQADPEYTTDLAVAGGWRSVLNVPMLREGKPIGTIGVIRGHVGRFSDVQVELLRTFADQAVIAIENVRLFTELQTSNRELTTALDMQTATSDILRVISRSQTDVQPVFDTILTMAVRLLGAYSGSLSRIVSNQLELVALTSTDEAADAAMRTAFPQMLPSENPHAVAISRRAAFNVMDIEADPHVPEATRAIARARGYRSMAAVPLLHHSEPLGAIGVSRREPGGFTDDEIALLQTFADQAVIAIENVRLFKELEARTQDLTRSVGELQALGEVGQAISATLNLRTVLSTIVARATQLSGTDAGVIYEYDDQREVFVPRATEHLEAEIVETMLATPVRKGEGATGRLAEEQEPIQVPDILGAPAESRVRGALVRAGYRALLAVPLVREGHLLGGLTVIRKATGEFAPEVIELLRTFATQSALAIQNARLFREIEQKSRELAAASQHKSEFLANMSHELRTPLNAIIGFSEVLLDRMVGEVNEKQTEYLQDILSSGQHLLSLINDILDLSKVEAGRMELEPTDFDLPSAIDNALTLVRERATRRGITLGTAIDERVGAIRADERKVKQVLLNLLSNALKFTPERGRINVGASVNGGLVEVSVADTGVGIAPEDQGAAFEEFRQVGSADKKVEGTGLGLALCRKFVELHGGRIWVESEVGKGSTFFFSIPLRLEAARTA